MLFDNLPLIDYADITIAYSYLWQKFMWVVTWMQTHGIIIWDHSFTFFDISIGVAGTWILVSLIPIFGDPEERDVVYDDFGGW